MKWPSETPAHTGTQTKQVCKVWLGFQEVWGGKIEAVWGIAGCSSALFCNLLQSLEAKPPLKSSEMSNQLLLKRKNSIFMFYDNRLHFTAEVIRPRFHFSFFLLRYADRRIKLLMITSHSPSLSFLVSRRSQSSGKSIWRHNALINWTWVIMMFHTWERALSELWYGERRGTIRLLHDSLRPNVATWIKMARASWITPF